MVGIRFITDIYLCRKLPKFGLIKLWQSSVWSEHPFREMPLNIYTHPILAEMPESTLHDVAQNIMDEPIPEEVKRRLLKPLLPRKPRPSPAPRPRILTREKKGKAIVREFDQNFPSKALRTTADYKQEIPNLFDVASKKKKTS